MFFLYLKLLYSCSNRNLCTMPREHSSSTRQNSSYVIFPLFFSMVNSSLTTAIVTWLPSQDHFRLSSTCVFKSGSQVIRSLQADAHNTLTFSIGLASIFPRTTRYLSLSISLLVFLEAVTSK